MSVVPEAIGSSLSPLERSLAEWLSDFPERGLQFAPASRAVLATDIGLKRKQNQDRTAALRIHPQDHRQPFFCLALSDGMGGMMNGAECATLALAGLFSSLIESSDASPDRLLHRAVMDADRLVHRYAGGRGGATLSAVLIPNSGPAYQVNVGDSRIYGLDLAFVLSRLTVDDTLQEAFGGQGSELVQYIGLGSSLMPHLQPLAPEVTSAVLTSDGVHFIDPTIFKEVIRNAGDLRRSAERVSALARWLGGHDNGTYAAVGLEEAREDLREPRPGSATFWSVHGTLQMLVAELRTNPSTPDRPATPTPPLKNSSKRRRKKQGDDAKPLLEINIRSGEHDIDS